MSYKYNNVVIKPGLYLGNQSGLSTGDGGSSPIFSSMQLSLDGTNDLSRVDDNLFLLPGYKAVLYKNSDISYIYVSEIDNTNGSDIRGVLNGVYNTSGANQISKIDLFYNNVKIDYSNIKTMGFKAAARLCWGAKLGQYSDGSYNKYALILESSTPRLSGGQTVESTSLAGINRPYLSLPWVQALNPTKASHSFWWCSKGYENGAGNADINYELSLYSSGTYSNGTILNFINTSNIFTEIFFEAPTTGNLTFYISNVSNSPSKYKSLINICDGLWHHIVWNINGTNWTIYTDGVAEATVSKIAYNVSILNNNTTQIGARGFVGNDTATNGYIADYRFYKDILTTTDINGLLNGDHTYKTSLDPSSCLFQYTFDPSAVYTNNYTTYAIGAATVPYAAELRNGADIILPSMDLTDSVGKNIKIYPFTIGANGLSISFWWRSDGLWATQGANSRLFYLGNGDETNDITFSLEIGSNGYPSIKVANNVNNLYSIQSVAINSYPILNGITPLIWYKFDGDVVNYGSGSGLNGTGTPSFSSSIVKYGTQSFDATSSFNVPTVSLNSLNGITFSFWAYSDNEITEVFFNTIDQTEFFQITISTNLQLYMVTADTTDQTTISDNINSGRWIHYVISLTYSSGQTSTWKVYLNGILKNTFTNYMYFSANDYTTNTIGSNTAGFFDDFRIYQTVLTDEQVLILSSNIQNLTTLTNFCDDTWKHVVWTIAPDSTWKLYVNNALINTYTGMAYPDVIQRSTNYIGSGYLTTDRYPCGFIGDFRIYDAVLSSDNVASLYKQTDTSDNEINLIQHYDFVEDTMNAKNNILYSNAPIYALEVTNATSTTGTAGQYGSMPSGLAATGTNGLTISFWWKAKGLYAAQGTSYPTAIDFGSSTTIGDDRIIFFIRNSTNAYPMVQVINIGTTSTGSESTVGDLTTLTDFCDGDWKHVVWTMTYSASNTSTWNLYVNNQRYGLGNLTTTGYYPVNIARGNAYFGRSFDSTFNYANGYIADVRVYKEVFTPEKITDLYNKVYTSETNLLLHTLYPTKTAPFLNNGAKIPFTSSKTELKINSPQTPQTTYYKLDVSGGSHARNYYTLTDFPKNTGVSFAFWFKPTATQGAANPMVFDFGWGQQDDNIFFGKDSASNAPYIRIYQGTAGRTNFTLSNNFTFFSAEVWKHVVWTMTYSDSTTSTWNVYINGQQYGGAPLTTTGYYPNNASRLRCYIGKSNWSTDGITYGQIADFRIYNSVLNIRNVIDLYTGIYTDNTSLFLRYPIDASGSTYPNDRRFYTVNGATISQETITVPQGESPPSTSLYLATDPSLNYHRGSYLSIPPLVKTGTNGLSFSIWWRADATYLDQGPWSRLFSFSNGKARDSIEFILRSSTNSYPNVTVHNTIKSFSNDITSITSLCDGSWKHIVWTMTYCAPTQNTSTWIVYLDGTATTITTAGTYPKNVSRKYAYIGQSSWIQNMYPTGDFADFRVYGAVLTQANVNSLYALTNTTDKEGNLLLRQKFDSTESYLYQTCDNIKPSVLFENDPDITITSSGQHVVLPTLPGLLSTDVPDERGISISFWWKSKGLSGTSGMLFESGLSQGTDVLFLRTRSGLNTYMSAQYYYGTNIDVDLAFAAGDGDIENLENGEWHHIVWTLSYEGNGQKSYWKYYMDGYFIKTTTLNTTGYLDGLNNTYALKQVNNFIGRSNWATINGCLNGYMSDFRIYNKCLTTQDVGDLYTDMYYDNSDLFLRYSFEKKIQIDNSNYTNIKAETDPSIIILLENGGATVVDNDTANSPSGFSSFLQLTGTTRKWARLYTLTKSFASNQLGLSFSFWFKPTGSHGTGNPMIFDFGNAAGNNNVYFAKQNGANYPYLGVYKGTTSSELIQLSNTTGVHVNDFFSNQVWKHIVWTMTYSASNTSTWNVYFNGQQYSGTAIKTNAYYPNDIGRTGNYIGDSNWTTNGGLSGNITGFRIYTTALTQANVTALYNNTFTDTTNLFFSTDFKPKYNINLTPSHSTDTTQVARLYNGATLSTDTYKFGTSSLFLSNYSTTANVAYSSGPGYGQCMQTIAPLPKLGTNGISFSFWWKSAGLQGSSSTIFDFAEDANNRITFYDVSNNSTSPIVQVLTGSGTKYDYNLNKTNFNNGDWHHVVWNINKFNNTWEIFYDNVSSGTINNEIYPDNVSRPFCFFGRSTVSTELYANGYIDEFRIYSKALTSTDVANLYTNVDTTSLQENLILYYSFNQDACRNVMDEIYINNNILDTPIFNV